MIPYSQLQKGVRIILEGQPCEITEAKPLFKGRGHSILQARLKNLKTNTVISKTFHPSDNFEEAEVSKKEVKFLYSHREKYVFSEKDNPSQRFELTAEKVGEQIHFLKENQTVEALIFEGKVINISLPIKTTLKVTEAPPAFKGNRAEAGTKTITLETGAKISAPLFIKKGDVVEVNTETGEYVRRV
jgi:elongation factor P